MNYVAEPIERFIRHWETLAFWAELQREMLREGLSETLAHPLFGKLFSGPAVYWREFRQHLLDIHTKGFDYKKFVGPYVSEPSAGLSISDFEEWLLPARIASWMLYSRRVYSMPTDLQLLLANTTLEGINWDMVNWPFESFLLSLKEPLDFEGKRYDSILVCDDMQSAPEPTEYKTIVLLADKANTIEKCLCSNRVERIRKLIKKGKLEEVGVKLTSIAAQMGSKHMRIIRINRGCFGADGMVSQLELRKWENQLSKSVSRILFGFLFYLQSVPPQAIIPDGWRKDPMVRGMSSQLISKITREADVCNIYSLYRLTDEKREIFKKVLSGDEIGGVTEVSPHPREGHWRRPPRKGWDPTHPKTVWVRPTIVRRILLADGGLPGGLIKEV